MNRVVALLVLIVIAGPLANVSEAAWVKGKWVTRGKYEKQLKKSTYRRPFAPDEKRIDLTDLRIANLKKNHKGIEVGATVHPNGTAWAYRKIVIQNCRISDAWRSPGIHSDFIRIFGGGANRQDVPTTVLLSDIWIHDGNALPIIIQDGEFDKIHLRNIRVDRTANSVQLVCINSGSMEDIYIDSCPGLRVSICGRPGSIKRVHVTNSPGAKVVDCVNAKGVSSGVKIKYYK